MKKNNQEKIALDKYSKTQFPRFININLNPGDSRIGWIFLLCQESFILVRQEALLSLVEINIFFSADACYLLITFKA